MTLLSKASFLVTPNGYKEDKLYAAIPTNGNGDMTFTRATTATRVNEAGLIELVPYNLLLRSQEFNNASWSLVKATISANATTAPDGTTTADTLTANGASGQHYVLEGVTVVDTATYTCSIYAKAGTNNFIQFILGSTPFASTAYCNFDLSNGSIGTAGSTALSPFAVSIGNGWYRIGFSAVAVSTGSANFFPVIVTSNTAIFFESNTLTTSVYLWGAQLVEGSSALTYQKTVDRLDIPRIDYTGGGCPSILLEPLRTNIVLRSQEFDNATWSKQTASVTTNSTISPSGVQDAEKIQCTSTASTQKYAVQTISVSVGSYTASFFVKADTYGSVAVVSLIGGTVNISYFNITSGTKGTTTSGTTSTIEDYGDGWYRVTQTATETVTTNRIVGIYFANSALNSITYSGSLTDSFFIWGAQLEAGAYPTSYIPTVASTVTRNADAISKTGISALIGQTEGVLFVESAALFNDLTNRQISLSDGTTNNRILIWYESSSNNIRVSLVISNIFIFSINYSISDETQFAKIAVRYSNTLGYSLWVNGVNRNSNASTSIPSSIIRLGFDGGAGGSVFFAKVKQVQLYKTYLTDAEMASLTTL